MFGDWSIFKKEPVVDYTKMVDDYGKTTAPITSKPPVEKPDDLDMNKLIDDILYGLTI
jgi:hypothetical protein